LKNGNDLIWPTAGEVGLILAISGVAWAVRSPVIFASLGPTAYELVEQPQLKSARTYNVVVGHMIALGCAFFSVFILNGWNQPHVLSTGIVTPRRLAVIGLAVALTTFVTLIAKASQPASLATCLLVALGTMQTERDALSIISGVLIIAFIGEPVRRIRLRKSQLRPQQSRA
jgi:hypothetical protein